MNLELLDPALHVPWSRVTDALALLARAGADVGGVEMAVRRGAVEIGRPPRALVVPPPPPGGEAPSVPRLLTEVITFLIPRSDELMRRIAREVGDIPPLDPLVSVCSIDPTILIDSRYATTENCTTRALYPAWMRERCFVRRSVADRLCRAQASLRAQRRGLKIWDGYRPHSVQWQCVDPQCIPDPAIRALFVSPVHGSNHARGCAVDVTLMDAATESECVMPTPFDSPAPQAAADATEGLSLEQLENRRVLRAAMTEAGLTVLPHEWWHFNYRPDGRVDQARNAGDLYLALDIPFDTLPVA